MRGERSHFQFHAPICNTQPTTFVCATRPFIPTARSFQGVLAWERETSTTEALACFSALLLRAHTPHTSSTCVHGAPSSDASRTGGRVPEADTSRDTAAGAISAMHGILTTLAARDVDARYRPTRVREEGGHSSLLRPPYSRGRGPLFRPGNPFGTQLLLQAEQRHTFNLAKEEGEEGEEGYDDDEGGRRTVSHRQRPSPGGVSRSSAGWQRTGESYDAAVWSPSRSCINSCAAPSQGGEGGKEGRASPRVSPGRPAPCAPREERTPARRAAAREHGRRRRAAAREHGTPAP
jgi:hypothetical protein